MGAPYRISGKAVDWGRHEHSHSVCAGLWPPVTRESVPCLLNHMRDSAVLGQRTARRPFSSNPHYERGRNEESFQHHPVCRAAVQAVAGVHLSSRAHAGLGHWRHDSHLHADPCGDAALPARLRPGAAVPRGRRRQTAASKAALRSAGACFPSRCTERLKAAAPEFEEIAAFQAGGGALEREA